MQESCRSSDFLARMGGDEFVILAPGMTQARFRKDVIEINAIARKAGKNVSGEDLLSVSSGAAFYPEDGSEAGQLLFKADKAMYQAKLLRYKQRETTSILERPVLVTLEQQFQLEKNKPLLN
jgi:diguanylate cyclase (GGDEF)-like protein